MEADVGSNMEKSYHSQLIFFVSVALWSTYSNSGGLVRVLKKKTDGACQYDLEEINEEVFAKVL